MLHPEGYHGNRVTPNFIAEGGAWFNPENFTYLGWVLPLAERRYYIPDNLTVLDLEAAIARVKAIHSSHPFFELDNNNQEVTMSENLLVQRVQEWYNSLLINYRQVPIEVESSYDKDSKILRITVIYKRVGLVVKGHPTLDVTITQIPITLTFERVTPSSVIFSSVINASHGDTIIIPRLSSINLNGGSITNGDPESITLPDGRIYNPENNIPTSLDFLSTDKFFTIS